MEQTPIETFEVNKHLENINLIQGMYAVLTNINDEQDVILCYGGEELWFENNRTQEKLTIHERSDLEALDINDLAKVIIRSFNEIR